MTLVRSFAIVATLLFYGFVFIAQDRIALNKENSLPFPMPAKVYEIAGGYFKQVISELLFIRSAVFLGGLAPGASPLNYRGALESNFRTMSSLYPQFVDPYYYCQSYLATISPEDAAKANSILEVGMKALPNDQILRFFAGYNYFMMLEEPLKGAEVFQEAAKIPGASSAFGRLAALMSARGGQFQAGVLMLRGMLEVEENEGLRIRYQNEIAAFEKAMAVEAALTAFQNAHARFPQNLKELLPHFLENLPDFGDAFQLVYDPPHLSLRRPEITRQKSTAIPWR